MEAVEAEEMEMEKETMEVGEQAMEALMEEEAMEEEEELMEEVMEEAGVARVAEAEASTAPASASR